MITFAPAFTHAVPSSTRKRSGAEEGEALHIRKVFANALCLELLNVGNSITQIKYMAEVGTTGRYYMLPVGVQGTYYVLTHALRVHYYTNGVGVNSVCLFVRFPTT